MNLLVAGLGNELLRDDGVGIHAIRQLQGDPVDGVRYREIGTAMLYALEDFEWADCVLALDSMVASNPPGTIYRMEISRDGDEVPTASLHDLGIRSVFGFLRQDNWPRVVVLGVEPEVIDFGIELTPTVAGALPKYVDQIQQEIRRLLTPA